MVVVKKAMRFPPWAPLPSRKKTFRIRVLVTRLEGLPPLFSGRGGGNAVAAVEARWKRSPRARALSYLMGKRRRKHERSLSRWKPVGDAGAVEWGEEDGNAFENVCCFSDDDGAAGAVSDRHSLSSWDVSFSILHGSCHEEGRKENQLEEIGSIMVNLAEWARAFHSQKHGQGIKGRESQPHVQSKQLPITLRKAGLTSDATLHVTINFMEVRVSEETEETPTLRDEPQMGRKESQQEEQLKDGRGIDASCTFDSELLDLNQLHQLANEEDFLPVYRSRNHAATSSSSSSSSGSSTERLSSELRSTSKHSFLYWRKNSKNTNKINEHKEEESRNAQASSFHASVPSESSRKKGSLECEQDGDPIGSWEDKEIISRDKQTKLKSQIFFASIDQRDESAGGEGACTALVAVITNALLSGRMNTPCRSEFDALIREGSLEWRKLCDNAFHIDKFPNKHFDLDTILEAKIRSISVLPEKSFIGFFQPESFESLRGAMSFDDIWEAITDNVGKGDLKVYIVSWNDHFFVLKVEADAYTVIDTLGERLFEGCNKAYILRFDDSTEMYRLPDDSESPDGNELICRGRECCREFINRFLAAIPMREELEVEKKGAGTANTALHQRLQIEFQFTEASNKITSSDDDWRLWQ